MKPILKNFLNSKSPVYNFVLAYGPDRGLVSETIKSITDHFSSGQSDPFSFVQIDLDTISDNPGYLIDEANTISMFGDLRVIHIKIGRHQARDQLQVLLDTPPENTLICLEAGDIKKSSPLVKQFSQSDVSLVLPCYNDQNRDLLLLIQEVADEYHVKISASLAQEIKHNLGSDRLTSRKELEKLCLYIGQGHEATLKMVKEILSDSSGIQMSNVLDASALAQPKLAISETNLLLNQGSSPDSIMLALLRHFQTLRTLRYRLDSGMNIDQVLKTSKPPIFFMRHDTMKQQLRNWPATKLDHACERIQGNILKMRQNYPIAKSLLLQVILGISKQASSG